MCSLRWDFRLLNVSTSTWQLKNFCGYKQGIKYNELLVYKYLFLQLMDILLYSLYYSYIL